MRRKLITSRELRDANKSLLKASQILPWLKIPGSRRRSRCLSVVVFHLYVYLWSFLPWHWTLTGSSITVGKILLLNFHSNKSFEPITWSVWWDVLHIIPEGKLKGVTSTLIKMKWFPVGFNKASGLDQVQSGSCSLSIHVHECCSKPVKNWSAASLHWLLATHFFHPF